MGGAAGERERRRMRGEALPQVQPVLAIEGTFNNGWALKVQSRVNHHTQTIVPNVCPERPPCVGGMVVWGSGRMGRWELGVGEAWGLAGSYVCVCVCGCVVVASSRSSVVVGSPLVVCRRSSLVAPVIVSSVVAVAKHNEKKEREAM